MCKHLRNCPCGFSGFFFCCIFIIGQYQYCPPPYFSLASNYRSTNTIEAKAFKHVFVNWCQCSIWLDKQSLWVNQAEPIRKCHGRVNMELFLKKMCASEMCVRIQTVLKSALDHLKQGMHEGLKHAKIASPSFL